MTNSHNANADWILVSILRYLLDHPEAADTARGVREWWLAGLAASERDVEKALQVLEARRWVRVKRMNDGQALYEANVEFLGAIRKEIELEAAEQLPPSQE